MTPLKLESASALVKLKLTSACRGHRSDNFSEFVIFLMGQHKYDVSFSNNCPTCGGGLRLGLGLKARL